MTAESPLDGYEVLLSATGGVACYKSCELVSRLVQAGAAVTVAMTEAATRFVGPLTFQSLTGREVYTDLWSSSQRYDPQHIGLTDRADAVVVAPATANIIGKIASGIADDLVSALAMTALAETPMLLAPAMNTRMWNNPVVQDNLRRLGDLGVARVGPNEGWLACRTVGKGRMAEPAEIFEAVRAMLKRRPPKTGRE
jgi:phosphopantothenoylcysteine decarboxylase/phosphopantothenate--cysteine ligase